MRRLRVQQVLHVGCRAAPLQYVFHIHLEEYGVLLKHARHQYCFKYLPRIRISMLGGLISVYRTLNEGAVISRGKLNIRRTDDGHIVTASIGDYTVTTAVAEQAYHMLET